MSLEFNKIAAAVLTGGVIAMTAGFVADLLVHEQELEESVYKVAGVEAPAEAAAEQGPGLEPVLPLLAAADPAEGESVAKKCTACHSFEEGGPNKVGPNLYGIVGAKIGHLDNFSYSDALLNAPDETWSYSALNAFLANPKDYAPGTKMSFAGLSKVEDRAAIIAYLRSLAASPQPLPTQEEIDAVTAAPEQAAEAAGETATEAATETATAESSGIAMLLAGADIENGRKVARKCAACHSFDKGAANKVGPNLYGVVGADIAGHEGFKYSDVLAGMEGTWDYEALSAFIADPKGFAPGTKMTFAGVGDEKDRADLILYLRSLSDNPAPLPESKLEQPAAPNPPDNQQSRMMSPDDPRVKEGLETAKKMLAAKQQVEERSAALMERFLLQQALAERVKGADPGVGEKLALEGCANCHKLTENGADKIGPDLFGVMGRDIAGLANYSYSPDLNSVKGRWDYLTMDHFLEDPSQVAPGLAGRHPSLENAAARAAIVAHLRLQAPSTYPLDP